MSDASRDSRRLVVIVSCATGLASLVVYAATLAPGLQGGDAGELAVAAQRFSVAHPPGYPLYVLLGRLATWVPLGTVAMRLNAFSALCMAGAVALATAAVARSTSKPWIGASAGMVYAFSPLVWTWATQAEVFALNALLAAALLFLAQEYTRKPSARVLYLGAVVCGLGLGNHHTLVLLGAPLAAAAAARASRRQLLHATLWMALGLSVYAQLPLGQWLSPEVAWGDVGSLRGLVHHLVRADYGSFALAAGRQTSGFAGLGAFLQDEVAQLLGLGTGLALAGAVHLLRQERAHRPLAWALIAAWLLCAVAFHLLARFPVDTPLFHSVLARFWIQPHLIACFLMGHGVAWLASQRRHGARIAAVLGVALVAGQLVHGWLGLQRSPVPLVEPYAHATLAELPEGAVLLTRGDLAHNALRYALFAEEQRPDVVLLDQELMTYGWYVAHQAKRSAVVFPAERYHPTEPNGFTLATLLEANPERSFFVLGSLKPGDDSLGGRFVQIPHGLATRLVPASTPTAELEALHTARPTLARLARSELSRAVASPGLAADPWSQAVVQEYWAARQQLPRQMLAWISLHGIDPDALRECVADYRALIADNPDASFAVFKNLGLAFGLQGDRNGQLGAFRAYLSRAPRDEVDRTRIEALVAEAN